MSMIITLLSNILSERALEMESSGPFDLRVRAIHYGGEMFQSWECNFQDIVSLIRAVIT